MNNIDLKEVPIKNGKYDWKSSKGSTINAEYNGKEYTILILSINDTKLTVKCNDKISLISPQRLKECYIGNVVNVRTKDFKIKIGTHFKDNNRDIIILDRKYIINENGWKVKYYKYKCNVCGYNEGLMNESCVLKGIGCSCCHNLTVVEGINDIPTTAPWMVKYFQGGYKEAKLYTKSSNQKIKSICPECGEVKNIIVNNLYKQGLSCICNDGFSHGHKYVYNILKQLNANFVQNKIPTWCKFYNSYKEKNTRGEYDFIIKDFKLIIEVDGEFHRKDNHMSGQTKEESQYLDYMKDRLAEENGYEVVRISDKGDFKENILNSKLSIFFDLNNINWQECEEFTFKNIIKEVCMRWNNKSECETTKDLEIEFNTFAIRDYLKKGAKLGWCSYDSKDEMIKNGSRSGKYKNKKVEVFKDGISIGIFESVKSLAEKSIELFSVKLNKSNIALVARGETEYYKGFKFKYVKGDR